MVYPNVEDVQLVLDEIKDKINVNENKERIVEWITSLPYPGLDALTEEADIYVPARDREIYILFTLWKNAPPRWPTSDAEPAIWERPTTFEDFLQDKYQAYKITISLASRKILDSRGLCEIMTRDTLEGLLQFNILPESPPGIPIPMPDHGDWIDTPQFITIKCVTATKIYLAIRNTIDGSDPPLPPEPTEYSNDGSITGNEGSFQLSAGRNQNKRFKIRLRGYNDKGYGITSDPYLYIMDCRR